jgi:hypothetical protein
VEGLWIWNVIGMGGSVRTHGGAANRRCLCARVDGWMDGWVAAGSVTVSLGRSRVRVRCLRYPEVFVVRGGPGAQLACYDALKWNATELPRAAKTRPWLQ